MEQQNKAVINALIDEEVSRQRPRFRVIAWVKGLLWLAFAVIVVIASYIRFANETSPHMLWYIPIVGIPLFVLISLIVNFGPDDMETRLSVQLCKQHGLPHWAENAYRPRWQVVLKILKRKRY